MNPQSLQPVLADGLLDWLLGLSKVSWSDPRTTLAWRWPLPLWGWLLIAACAAVVAGWSYRHLLGPRWARVALGVLRAAILLLIAALLVGPMIVLNQEKVDPDWLVFLVDRSASMRIRDMHLRAAGGTGGGGATTAPGAVTLISRDLALRTALARNADLFGPDRLGANRRLLWLGFDAGTYEIDAPSSTVTPQAPPDGQSTLIRTAIEQALQRAVGRPISGIVLMSDGRSPQSTSGDLVRRLQQVGVSVFTVPLGGDVVPMDLSIAQVEAPDRAFINDAVPVRVWIEAYPEDARIDPARVHVRLVDTMSGRVLDQRSPSSPDLHEPVHLTAQSAGVGPTHWRIELVYDAPTVPPEPPVSASTPPTTRPGNPVAAADSNDDRKRELSVELTDKPIRVLYVEGYPRWEYRYLKNMLVREASVQSSIMLVSADRSFAQEGQVPIQRLPHDAEEFKPYDVIIIGDVAPEFFSPEQKSLIVDQVATRGAGLLWIGGSNNVPRSYEGDPLAGLLPMRSPASVDGISFPGLHVMPTPLAEALQVMRLRDPGASESAGGSGTEDVGWPATLPPLDWAQALGPLKPSAEVLATVDTMHTSADQGQPLVTRLRYGAGQSLYVGTDETWRWRYGRGELYFEQFWMQLIRMLGRNRLRQGNDRVTIDVSSRRAQVDQPLVVTLTLNDELLTRRDMQRISVGVFRADNVQAGAVEHLDLLPHSRATPPGSTPGSPPGSIPGSTLGNTSGSGVAGATTYQAIWRPGVAGRLLLRVTEPALADLSVSQPVEILRPDDELRQRAPDRERMVALARDTNGAVVDLDHLNDLAKLVPNRARRTPNDVPEPLWNSYLAIIMVVGLLTVEWAGRKVIRLV